MGSRSRRSRRLATFGLAAMIGLAGCGGSGTASFDPGGPCVADGRMPGAYPDLEAFVPRSYRDAAPETLDSGRNCSAANLGTLAAAGIDEVRFAGATWSFGAERAVALAVFRADGLTAPAMAEFYTASAQAASRTTIVAARAVDVAGRTGRRLDTKTGERVQTVVVWPAATPGTVNVVITNDLPDARIQEAIDAFGGR